MRVILLKDVRGTGQHGEIKNVADGYAINYLFPQKFAEPASEERVKKIEEEKNAREALRQAGEEQLTRSITSLRGKTVTLKVRATEKGGLFKSVGAVEIAKAIKEQYEVEIPSAAIDAPPIKTVGEHMVVLNGPSQKVELTVAISAA